MEGEVEIKPGEKKGMPWAPIIAVSGAILALVGIFAWSLAFAEKSKRTGDPNSISGAACGGIPDGGSEYLHENIKVTSFGGCGKNGRCADSDDNCEGSSGLSTGCEAQTKMYAALPLKSIPALCKDDLQKCARIQVSNPTNNKSLVLAVVDTGPWYVNDKDYVMGTARPKAESGKNAKGRTTNKAGLDVSPEARKILGSDYVNWKFTNLPLSDNSASGCDSTLILNTSGAFYPGFGTYKDYRTGAPNSGRNFDGPDSSYSGGEAIDFGTNGGTPVYAPFDGKVVKAVTNHGSASGAALQGKKGTIKSGGILWMVSNDLSKGAVYAHIEFAPGIGAGSTVIRGKQIGTVARECSGSPSVQCTELTPHLHAQLYQNKKGLSGAEIVKMFKGQ